jgi:hypothetical protein
MLGLPSGRKVLQGAWKLRTMLKAESHLETPA